MISVLGPVQQVDWQSPDSLFKAGNRSAVNRADIVSLEKESAVGPLLPTDGARIPPYTIRSKLLI